MQLRHAAAVVAAFWLIASCGSSTANDLYGGGTDAAGSGGTGTGGSSGGAGDAGGSGTTGGSSSGGAAGSQQDAATGAGGSSAAAGAGGGAGKGGSSGSKAGLDGSACGVRPIPPGGACPAECTGGCATGLCRIDCTAVGTCNGKSMVCPPGFACDIACTAENTCVGSTIICPDIYACRIACNADRTCNSTTIQCMSGPCELECSAADSCRGTLACGVNSCKVACSGGASPNVDCGPSCACSPC